MSALSISLTKRGRQPKQLPRRFFLLKWSLNQTYYILLLLVMALKKCLLTMTAL